MSKILVTGGAGFIGSNLTEALLERGNIVKVLDNFATGKIDIRARLATTSNSWIGAIIFVMNLIRHMRDIPLSYFVSFLSKLMKVRNINIYPVKPQMKLCA